MSVSEVRFDELAAMEISDPPTSRRALHRIKKVRQLQGVSLRRVAHELDAEVRELRKEEEEDTDLPLSRVYDWQRVLEVPTCELLVDSAAPLSSPVMERAKLIRVMKTVAAIQEQAGEPAVRRLSQTLADQLVELMPELKGVSPWHSVGQRRSLQEYGRIVERPFSAEVWRDVD